MKSDAEIAKTSLAYAAEALENRRTGAMRLCLKRLRRWLRKGIKNGQILYPVRIALSGKETTPGGATELAVVLGKEETLNRIRTALSKLN